MDRSCVRGALKRPNVIRVVSDIRLSKEMIEDDNVTTELIIQTAVSKKFCLSWGAL